MTLTGRQAFALARPLGDRGLTPAELVPLRRVREHPRGLLTTILAVDRQARLNDGLPVWHVSASLQRSGRILTLPRPLEAAAVRLLAGVGGEREWWVFRHDAGVGHLRVNLTVEEAAQLAPGCAIGDAGETGPERLRTRR